MSINPEIDTNTAYIYDDVAATLAFGEVDDDYWCTYFGARYYDPNISIWLSVDPLCDKYPSTSPFMYVRGNPIMLIDPNGMNDDDFYYNQQGELIRHDVNAQPDRFFVQNGTTRVDNPRDLTPNPQQMQVPTFEEVGMNSDLGHMARTIYAEGAGQSTEAKVALGEVIRNRANDNTAPSSANNYNAQFSGVSTYEEVVTQSGQFESVSTMAPRYSNPLSVTGGDGVGPRNMLESNAFSSSMGAAIKCTYTPTNTAQGATYFFSPYIRTPNWAKSMTPVSIPGVSSSDFRFYKY